MSSRPASEARNAQRARGSIAARLTLWYAASAFLLILGVTGYLYVSLAASLAREDDEYLQDQLSILAGIFRDRPHDMAAIRQEVEWETTMRQYARSFVRILDGNGKVLAETPGMPPDLSAEIFPPPGAGGGGRTIRIPGGTFRVLSGKAQVGAPEGGTRILQVALDRASEEEILARFRTRAVPLLLVSLILCALVGYRIARRGTRPLRDISRAVGRVRSTTLRERIAGGGWPSELLSLAVAFNEMLERLERSFSRISRFSSDIAHELRTPLNNLRGELEVALTRARTAEEYREVLISCIEECRRLSRMIESLLFLARAEHPECRIEKTRVDMRRELECVREFYDAAAQEAGVRISVEAVEGLEAEVDRTLLQRALGNLVENALAHTPHGGSVTLRATREADHVRVEVADTGCGIAPEHLPRVFERLYRVDSSRAAATGGAGLGLSIVKSIAELHGGSAAIESVAYCEMRNPGTTAVLRLPAAAPATIEHEPKKEETDTCRNDSPE